MEALNVSSFRSDMSASFDRADRGERVFIRRKNKMYLLVGISPDEATISPALRQRMEEARKSYLDGTSRVCTTKEEIEDYLNSL